MHRDGAILAVSNPQTTRLLRANLRAAGFEVWTQQKMDGLDKMAKEGFCGLLVLGERFCDQDGLEICKGIRQFSHLPILMMGQEHNSAGVVAALDAGADDFLLFPYSMDEFFARTQALMRRVRRSVIQVDAGKKRIGGLIIDLGQRQVNNQGICHALTPTEYKLLMYLASRPEEVISHEEILIHVWGEAYAHCIHYLRVGIGRLRHKIEKDPAHPMYLVTCSGVGYMLQESPRS